jgi:hypothetical protein
LSPFVQQLRFEVDIFNELAFKDDEYASFEWVNTQRTMRLQNISKGRCTRHCGGPDMGEIDGRDQKQAGEFHH